MIAPKHILGTFDEALSSLRNNVLMMASLTERSLDRAITGLLQRDDEMCAIAIADDEEIDQLEKQVDKDGIDLLLRFQPVASDLRRVVSAMKLSSNLERMADQGTNIARRARKLNQHPPLPEAELIRQLKTRYTIVIVTHNMQQAGRCSDVTAFFYLGRLIEFDRTSKIFSNPGQRQTEEYITGRFG